MISKSAEVYCCEKISGIENYEKAIKDKNCKWHCHHKKETPSDGVGMSVRELIKKGLYYHRPAKELIFLTPEDHYALHTEHARIHKQTTKKINESKTNCSADFDDFLNEKNKIVKKYAIWIFRHPENRKELERQRDREITDLLDEYERREKASFGNMAKLKELGIRIDVKLLSKK